MKHIVLPFACILALIPTISSCSIRQDRSLCPDENKMSMLRLDLRSCAPDFKSIHLRVYDSEKIILQKTIRTDTRNPYDTTTVPLKDMKYTLWASKSGSAIIPEDRYNLLEGIPSDSLYAESGDLFRLDAPWTEMPVLHKQFMTLVLSLSLSRDRTVSVEYPNSEISFHQLEVAGPPVTDNAPISPEGMAILRIPRQRQNSQILLSTPTMKDTVDINRVLRSMRYDWNAPDLHDVLLEIDEGHSSFRISALPWDRGCDMSLRLSCGSSTDKSNN